MNEETADCNENRSFKIEFTSQYIVSTVYYDYIFKEKYMF